MLVLGPAALLLGATALAPVTLRSAVGAAVEEVPSLTVPLFAGTGAVLLVLLFVSTRALDRVRREARAEAEAAVAAGAS